ncbi:MAG: nicotinate (nicotinamide) nucleotide adenylyltransferase [Candidatus Neomarinimicrobiota bacterium]
MKRVGIFGGSFDPPHQAHNEIAALAIRRIPLDKLYLVPAWIALLKDHAPMAEADHRLAMVKLLAAELPGAEVLTYELDQQRAIPTLETVRYLQERDSAAQYYLIIGGDQAARFSHWVEWRTLLGLVKVICFHRKGPPPADGLLLHATFIEYENALTSTIVRDSIKAERMASEILSPAVADYVQRLGLYR